MIARGRTLSMPCLLMLLAVVTFNSFGLVRRGESRYMLMAIPFLAIVAAVSLDGRGYDLNAALGNLDTWAQNATRLLRVLDTQSGATSRFIRNTGVVFNALSERQGQLQGLIRNSNIVFQTTADRDEQLRQIFQIFPTFLEESRLTLNRLDSFAADTDPLMVQLIPAARQLSGALIADRTIDQL